ncbi:MAG: UDP-N-acetylmuramoyl-L-alanyl-D-glutamate--2,6-diaminopimelate ligase, partial [Firmicutes bacterium]|nr:UDP-N-acetylmuramoyl-L-alanyl-D-glutamate--2,6-diaminopimelate ligase [Bacillota bacterium]
TRVQSVAGRFNVVSSGGKNVVIDFAHTPEGMDNLLRAVREIYKGRVICVFGAGGNRDKAKRPKMGAVASRLADFSFLTADNPRDESVYEIISEIASGFDLDCKYRVVSNRSEAIKQALALSNGLDVVVIAGKGAEDYIEIKGVKTPYNDMEEVEKILNIEQ